MNHTPTDPKGARPSALVRRAIRRDERFGCTAERDCRETATAWCQACDAPRCDEHVVAKKHGPPHLTCRPCGGPATTFDAIRKGATA